jgi:cell wall-associated NlpC family hydrolase
MIESEGEQIARRALGWVGTPFIWQGRAKGVGCDCKGLIAGVAAEVGRPEANSIEALSADYGAKVDVRRLQRGLETLFDAVTGPVLAGDVLLLKIGGHPQHLGICIMAQHGLPWRMVHVYPSLGKVIDVPLGTAWRAQLAGVFRWKVLA